MRKELKEQIIKKTLKEINKKITLTKMPKIIFKKDLENKEGLYNFNKNIIYILETDNIDRMCWVLTHEIGHFIHWKYFKATNLNLECYSHKGHLEAFAENFTDYIYSFELSKDIVKIKNLLNSVSIK